MLATLARHTRFLDKMCVCLCALYFCSDTVCDDDKNFMVVDCINVLLKVIVTEVFSSEVSQSFILFLAPYMLRLYND